MAHQITVVNGIAEAMYAEKPAWHNLGKVLEFAPNSEEAIKAANLNWEVALEPFTTQNGASSDDLRAIVRQDHKKILGIVTEDYHPIQNIKCFEFLDSLLQDGIIRYESAFSLYGGRQVCILARMPAQESEVIPGDTHYGYALFSESHTGKDAAYVLPTTVRVVCANTVSMAVAEANRSSRIYRFSHKGDVDNKLETASQFISQFNKSFTLYNEKAKILISRACSREKLDEYLSELFPPTEAKNAKTRRDGKVSDVKIAAMHKTNTLKGMEGTWWNAFNAVTFCVDHVWKDFRGDNKEENRFVSIIDGKGAELKEKAWNVALAMATV